MIEQMYIARVQFEEARQLADAASIFQDLGFVVDVLTHLRSALEDQTPDGALVQSYWTAALIAYVRCFSSGKRGGLTESVFDGIEGRDRPAVDVHRHFKALRDKHVAHSVNPFEPVEVGAVLSPPSAPTPRVEGVATLSMRLISTSIEGVESLHELASIARRHIATECRRLQQVTQGVAETLDLSELYRTATMRSTAPAPEQAEQPRE